MKKVTYAMGATAIAAGAFLLHDRPGHAADHRDAASLATPDTRIAADINDVYAFLSGANGENLVLAMTVSPGVFADDVPLSPDVQYIFYVNQMSGPQAVAETLFVVCEFPAPTNAQCWISDYDDANAFEDIYFSGDASNPDAPLLGPNGIKLFAGKRSDPFFFNLSGFQQTVAAALNAEPPLVFNAAGCPDVDDVTSGALVGLLNGGGEAVDTFIDANTQAIVLELPKSALAGGQTLIGVHAGTRLK